MTRIAIDKFQYQSVLVVTVFRNDCNGLEVLFLNLYGKSKSHKY